MTIQDRKALKQASQRRLKAASYNPRRLMAIHSGVAMGVALLVAVLNYVIAWQIDAKGGGLAGLPMRSVLDTAATVLTILQLALSPFWAMGLSYATLRQARGKSAYPATLLEGFRRFGPVLRMLLMEGIIYSIITLAAMYGAYFFYGLTPAGQAFNDELLTMLAQGMDYMAIFESIPQQTIDQVSRIYLPVFLVVWLVLVIPAAYRMRLAPYVLMDKEGTGAWKAIRTSGKLTRRNCGKLLVLDLSYWWYYLIPAVLMLPAYADLLLPLVGIPLPADAEVVYLAGYVTYGVLTLIFQIAAKPKVAITYALTYDVLLEAAAQAEPPKPAQPEERAPYSDVYGYPPRSEE